MILAALVIIRLYDGAGVAAHDDTVAKATASAILHDAGVDVRWRDCSIDRPCNETLGRSELIVRVIASKAGGDPRLLGYSFVDVDRREGTLATVFADRVSVLARNARVDGGEILGLAVAHEVGHLLLGRADHATTGLMRAHWTAAEIQRRRADDWRWLPEDRAAIRLAAAARSNDQPQLVADGERPDPTSTVN